MYIYKYQPIYPQIEFSIISKEKEKTLRVWTEPSKKKLLTFVIFRFKRVVIAFLNWHLRIYMMPILLEKDSVHIREVWKHNLGDEISLIRDIVDKYPYVAMDTEFPGTIIKPVNNFKNRSDYNYHVLKENVNLLKLIHLGLTFADSEGNLPTCETDKYCVWQFNFSEFSIKEDPHASDSIELLSRSGIDFDMNKENGVTAFHFGELLVSSGVVLNDEVHWIAFHGGSDFGYLLKLLTGRTLPDTREKFFELIKIFFPNVYDIKHIMKFFNFHGGLNRLAEKYGVERIGSSHQAGSDSLLTCCTFMKLKETTFDGCLPVKYAGVLYDLGDDQYDQSLRRN